MQNLFYRIMQLDIFPPLKILLQLAPIEGWKNWEIAQKTPSKKKLITTL